MRQGSILVWAMLTVGVVAVGATPELAHADDGYVMTFKDNKLEPVELQVPAGKEFKLLVKNADQTPEEFESEDLKLEKIIAGGSEAEFTIKALEPGRYEVFGEFHEDTAKGHIVAD
jgi:hypothetical protein